MPENNRGGSAYPEKANYAIYELIWALGLVMICLGAAMALINHA